MQDCSIARFPYYCCDSSYVDSLFATFPLIIVLANKYTVSLLFFYHVIVSRHYLFSMNLSISSVVSIFYYY